MNNDRELVYTQARCENELKKLTMLQCKRFKVLPILVLEIASLTWFFFLFFPERIGHILNRIGDFNLAKKSRKRNRTGIMQVKCFCLNKIKQIS